MRSPHKTRLVLVTGLIAAAVGTGGVSVAALGHESPGPRAISAQPTPSEERRPVVENERGMVLEGFATWKGLEVSLTVYENDRYGNEVTVVVGDPDDGGLIGTAQSTEAFVQGGRLHAVVRVDGRDAVLTGTVAESGRPEHFSDSVQDAGQQINTRGAHTPLRVDATFDYLGETAPASFATGFAYDLRVQKVTLYGR